MNGCRSEWGARRGVELPIQCMGGAQNECGGEPILLKGGAHRLVEVPILLRVDAHQRVGVWLGKSVRLLRGCP